MLCSYQSQVNRAKEHPNGTKPAISSISLSYESGTSSETTRSVRAKANTASLNASTRVISCLRAGSIAGILAHLDGQLALLNALGAPPLRHRRSYGGLSLGGFAPRPSTSSGRP